MASISRILKGLFRFVRPSRAPPPPPATAGTLSFGNTFSEGDRVLLRAKKNILSAPLQKNSKINLPATKLLHNDIIGQASGAFVKAQNGSEFRVVRPTLEQYVTLIPRKVTPIYAHDASLIANLLDINVSPYDATETRPRLEILEAGTGHGSLTLHLARAIHAANSPPPFLPPPVQRKLENDGHITKIERDITWETYAKSRQAIIHTIDISPSFSIHAEKVVRGFMHGMYATHVDFNVSHVSDWISEQLRSRAGQSGLAVEPFISYAVLDMPSAHLQLDTVARVLRQDALLAIFVPSVTQIGDCVRQINEHHLPLVVEKTIELGMGISNGRLWDVRLAAVRARSTSPSKGPETLPDPGDEKGAEDSALVKTTTHTTESEIESSDIDQEDEAISTELPPSTQGSDEKVLVCRPKVGERIVGGGFVGLFRKITPQS